MTGASGDKKGLLARLPFVESISILVAVTSLVVALIAHRKAAKREWEQDRPLASLNLVSEIVEQDADHRFATYELTIVNQGALTFAIRDITIEFESEAALSPDWAHASLRSENTLSLPLGMRAFSLESTREGRARYGFREGQAIWHVVDPGREVSIPFLIPISGAGVLTTKVTVYLQGVPLAAVEETVTEPVPVAGITRPAVPEFGVDEDKPISSDPVFPYSASALVVATALAEERAPALQPAPSP